MCGCVQLLCSAEQQLADDGRALLKKVESGRDCVARLAGMAEEAAAMRLDAASDSVRREEEAILWDSARMECVLYCTL